MDGDDGSTPADFSTVLYTTSSILHETTALSWTTGEGKGTKTDVLHHDDDYTTADARVTQSTQTPKIHETTTEFRATGEDKATQGFTLMTSFNTMDKSLVISDVSVAILAGVVVITILIVVISIVWKCKMKKKTRQPSIHKYMESSSEMQINIEIYENIKQGEVAVVESTYENTKWPVDFNPDTNSSVNEQQSDIAKWPVDFNPATNSSVNEQECDIASTEARRYELDTPDGTYEIPNVDVYSYADPNELRLCLKK